jgi:hypothetical protein
MEQVCAVMVSEVSTWSESWLSTTPRRRTLGSPLIPVVVSGSTTSPRTYVSRKVEAEDSVAKHRSTIFLISARRSPSCKKKRTGYERAECWKNKMYTIQKNML